MSQSAVVMANYLRADQLAQPVDEESKRVAWDVGSGGSQAGENAGSLWNDSRQHQLAFKRCNGMMAE